MVLLLISAFIALLTIFIGVVIMKRAGREVSMNQLHIFIALATGFMISVLFFDLLPENMERFAGEPKFFFRWALFGMALVVFFERFGVPRLKFIEKFFKHDEFTLKKINVSEDHHHHHDLNEAEHCDQSHNHAHVHSHTHLELLGQGEVCSAIACFMICSFFDGMALSSIQAVSPRLGVLLIMGVVLHLLPEGILSGAMVLAGGASLKSAQKVITLIGGSFMAGALVPFFIRGHNTVFVAISSGILLFVTLVQLLPTALKMKSAMIWISLGGGMFLLTHAFLRVLGYEG